MDSVQPLFSIIVPVYKVEKYVKQCIDSLLAQEFNDYEIILVDDGSPDKCPQICDDYAENYENVRVIHKENGGLSDARNKGVEESRGKYVTFVDSDDFWKENFVLSDIAGIIERYNPDIIVSDFIKYYDDSDKYIFPTHNCELAYNGKPKIEILKYLYFCHADMKMSACQKFAKRELLTCNPFTKGLLSEDIDWSLGLYPMAKSICLYDNPYYCYRQQREGSITNTASQRSFDSLLYIITKWNKVIPTLDIPLEEKDIYFGYLAYQLSIAISLLNRLEKQKRKEAITAIKNNRVVFDYGLNSKTKKVKVLLAVFGVRLTAYILSKYIQQRHRINKL